MNSSGPDLERRLAREAQYHDVKYAGHEGSPRHYAASPTQYIYTQLRAGLGDITDKQVLEYGCGEGWITSDLARMGANVRAFDISHQAIETAKQHLISVKMMERCQLEVMPAERLTYADNCFDVAIGFAIIHHLDLPKALAELHRVLKPGGVAYFAEPLATNPLIQAYRLLTPQFRTPDEAPLRLSALPGLLGEFSGYEHREFYLTALGAIALTYLPGGMRIFPRLSARLHGLDRAILRAMPALGPLAWYTVLKVTK